MVVLALLVLLALGVLGRHPVGQCLVELVVVLASALLVSVVGAAVAAPVDAVTLAAVGSVLTHQ